MTAFIGAAEGLTTLAIVRSLGYKDRPGFRLATSLPFNPLNPKNKKPMNLPEIPTIMMDTSPFYQKTNPPETINRIQNT